MINLFQLKVRFPKASSTTNVRRFLGW